LLRRRESGCLDGKHDEKFVTKRTWIAFHDIDGIWSRKQLEPAFKILKKQWLHALLIERSVSRNGIHVFTLTTATNEAQFKATWWEIQRQLNFLIEDIGHFHFDESTIQASKLCFPSGDREAFRNPNAEIFKARDPLPAKPQRLPSDEDWPFNLTPIIEKRLEIKSDWQLLGSDSPKIEVQCPSKSHRSKNHAVIFANRHGPPLRFTCYACKYLPESREINDWLVKQVEAMKHKALPPIENVTDILRSEIFLPPYVIKDVLPLKAKAMLAGGSKGLKTWAQQDLCLSVATGTDWLGFPTTQGHVLSLNFELEASYYRYRIQQLCHARGFFDLVCDRWHVWNLRGYAQDIHALLPEILAPIKDLPEQLSLMNLDPIYKVYGPRRKENDTGDMAEVMNALDALTEKSCAATLFGHHFPKGNQAAKEAIDRAAGAGVFARDADTVITFTKHEDSDTLSVEFVTRNAKEPKSFAVRWAHPLLKRDDTIDASKLKQPVGAKKPGPTPNVNRAKLLEILGEEHLLKQEWMKRVIEKFETSERRFREYFNQLVLINKVEQDENKCWFQPM
jgi:hypothetical protein